MEEYNSRGFLLNTHQPMFPSPSPFSFLFPLISSIHLPNKLHWLHVEICGVYVSRGEKRIQSHQTTSGRFSSSEIFSPHPYITSDFRHISCFTALSIPPYICFRITTNPLHFSHEVLHSIDRSLVNLGCFHQCLHFVGGRKETFLWRRQDFSCFFSSRKYSPFDYC